MTNQPDGTQYRPALSEAERALGYIRQDPPAATEPDLSPAWMLEEISPVETMSRELIESEWRVADLRDHIRRLGLKPKGRTRVALATQLAEAFMDRARIQAAVKGLPEKARHYYAHILLLYRLHESYAYPTEDLYWRDFSESWSRLTKPLVNTAVVMQSGEDYGLFLPFGIRAMLPQLSIVFPTGQAPSDMAPAGDPHQLLGQIQQMLGLLQSQELNLRAPLRWKAPEYPYAKSIVCWPLNAADAKAINNHTDRSRKIELRPAEPTLDDAALATITSALKITAHWAEFLYQLLIALGIVWPGDPVTLDQAMSQAWMALPPGEQIATIYRSYRNLFPWAAWWPLWQAGDLHLQRAYSGYWGLMSLDESVQLTTVHLRWVLLEILAALPHDTWLSVTDLTRWLHELFPKPGSHRYLMNLMPTTEEGDWPAFMDTVLLRMIAGPLHVFGLVDIGPTEDNIQSIRIRGLQDIHWGRTEHLHVATAETLDRGALRYISEEPALEVATPVPPDFMSLVLKWAQPAGFSRALIHYRLDVQQLHHAFEQGEDPASLRAAWRACVDFEPIPEIAAWWDTWWERYGRVRLYEPQAMLQTRDALTMHELQISLPKLQEAITSALSPEAALLTIEAVDTILSDLERQGYMPKESS